mmetsp:Transcript_27582/g.68760  ORF Transcript_27582/g.68760 Transcript_27582/m.68760 type:complete len:81 (-) Transcript_27582:2036-2278(-)
MGSIVEVPNAFFICMNQSDTKSVTSRQHVHTLPPTHTHTHTGREREREGHSIHVGQQQGSKTQAHRSFVTSTECDRDTTE